MGDIRRESCDMKTTLSIFLIIYYQLYGFAGRFCLAAVCLQLPALPVTLLAVFRWNIWLLPLSPRRLQRRQGQDARHLPPHFVIGLGVNVIRKTFHHARLVFRYHIF